MKAVIRAQRAVAAALFAATLAALPAARAQAPDGDELRKTIQDSVRLAAVARQRFVNHPRLSAYALEDEVRKAIAATRGGPGAVIDAAAAREKLRALERNLGPLEQIAHAELQMWLSQLAEMEGNADGARQRRAYAYAVLALVNASGDGKSPATAYRVVHIGEEYSWLTVQGIEPRGAQRVSRDIDGKKYDIWTVPAKGSAPQREVYFDVSAVSASMEREIERGQRAAEDLTRRTRDEGMRLRIGQSVDEARAATGSQAPQEPAASPLQPNATVIKDDARGVWLFFDAAQRLYTARFFRNFSGNVSGVRSGDSEQQVRQLLGAPVREFAQAMPGQAVLPGHPKAMLYRRDDGQGLRVNVSAEGMVTDVQLLAPLR